MDKDEFRGKLQSYSRGKLIDAIIDKVEDMAAFVEYLQENDIRYFRENSEKAEQALKTALEAKNEAEGHYRSFVRKTALERGCMANGKVDPWLWVAHASKEDFEHESELRKRYEDAMRRWKKAKLRAKQTKEAYERRKR